MTPRTVFRASALVVLAATALLATTACVVSTAPSSAPRVRPAPPPPPVAPPVSVDIRFFYDRLRPYGDWIRVDPYGWVWAPNRVSPFWRPYTVGRWVWTDWGWTWASDESWGWATYHYGRWSRVPRYGWVWVPGTEWGPAWVAWRRGGGEVGWAPLPPQARFRVGVGIDLGDVDIDVVIGRDWWCFVDPTRFVEPNVVRWVRPVGRNATLVPRTASVTRYRVVGNRVVNAGLAVDEIERVTKRKIAPKKIVEAREVPARGAVVERDDVRVYRPEVRPGPADAKPGSVRERPAETPSRPASTRPEVRDAEKRWDDRWGEDWKNLQREQRRDQRDAERSGEPTREVLPRQRSENYTAAENARRELEAAKERAARRAERSEAEKREADAASKKKAEDEKKPASTRSKGKKK